MPIRYDAAEYASLARCERHALGYRPRSETLKRVNAFYFIPPSNLPRGLLCGACLTRGEIEQAGLVCTQTALETGIASMRSFAGIAINPSYGQWHVKYGLDDDVTHEIEIDTKLLTVTVMIEIPKGGHNKYKYGKERRPSVTTACCTLRFPQLREFGG